MRTRRDASSSLQNAPTYTEEQVVQVFDTWYGQTVEQDDPHDPDLDLSPALRNDRINEVNGSESENPSSSSDSLTFRDQDLSGVVSAPPVTTFSRASGSCEEHSVVSGMAMIVFT